MGRPISQERIEREVYLGDLLDDSPEGVTREEICEYLECSLAQGDQAIRDVRIHRAGDSINLFAVYNGWHQPRLYKWVGDWDAAAHSVSSSVGGAESQMETIQAQMQSLLNGADKRTKDGQKVAHIEMTMRHALEVLASIDDQWAVAPKPKPKARKVVLVKRRPTSN